MIDISPSPIPAIVTPGPNDELPALPAFESRSFWALVIAAALGVAGLLKFDLLGWFGVEDGEALLVQIMPIITIAAPLIVWLCRRAPNFRLTAFEKTAVIKTTDGVTFKSPYLLGFGVLAVFLLGGCDPTKPIRILGFDVGVGTVNCGMAVAADAAQSTKTQQEYFHEVAVGGLMCVLFPETGQIAAVPADEPLPEGAQSLMPGEAVAPPPPTPVD